MNSARAAKTWETSCKMTGEARHHARWRELTEAESAAAAALRELAGGRADLLTEVVRIFEGGSEGEPDEPLACQPVLAGLRVRRLQRHNQPPQTPPARRRPPNDHRSPAALLWRIPAALVTVRVAGR